MFNLVQNENMKIYRRIRTWIMVGLLLLGVLATGLIMKYDRPQLQTTDWKQDLIQQNEEIQKQLDSVEHPIPDDVKKQMDIQIKKNQYAIDHNISPNQITGWKFSEQASFFVSLITIFVVIVAGDIVASEFGWGTIKLLLIRPVNRTKILISKYLATLLFAIFLLAIVLIWSILVGGVLFGFSGVDQPYIYAGTDGLIHERNMVTHVLLKFGLSSIELLMIVTFAFMISATFRSSSLAIGLSIFLLFTGNVAVQILSRFSWAKYILFANLNLAQYIEGTPLFAGTSLSFSLGVLVVYFVIFHLIAWLLFTKRDVAA